MYYDEEGIYKESEKTINSKPMMASPTKKQQKREKYFALLDILVKSMLIQQAMLMAIQ